MVGAGLVLVLKRDLPRPKLIFNLGQLGITAGVAAVLFHAVSGPVADPGPRVWAAAFLAVLLAAAMSVLLVGAAMWLSGDDVRSRKLWAMVGMAVAVAATNTSLGLAAGTVVGTDPMGAVLLLAPALAIFLAYRAYTSEIRQRTDLEFLHQASRTLSSASDMAPGVAGMLAMALEAFRGEVAEVCLLPAGDDANGRRITVGPAEHLEIMQPLAASVTDELAALITDPTARVVTPESLGGAMARPPAAARRARGDARPAAGRAPADGCDVDGQPARHGRLVRPRRPHAVRDARAPDRRGAWARTA